jgi:hypothetical protein
MGGCAADSKPQHKPVNRFATANFTKLTVKMSLRAIWIAVALLISVFVSFLDEQVRRTGAPELAEELKKCESGGNKEDAAALAEF